MNYKKYGLIIFSLISTVAIAAEDRSEMKFEAMPEAVRNTVAHFINQDNITKIEKVVDNGYVKFDVKSTKTVNNKDLLEADMTVAADGEIMKIAKEAPIFAVPFPVMQKVNQKYEGLKVDEVEIVQTRYFLLTGEAGGQPVNLKIFDDGDIQEISAKPSGKAPAPLTQPAGQDTVVPAPTPADDFDEPIPEPDDEPQIDRSDYNFDPNQSE